MRTAALVLIISLLTIAVIIGLVVRWDRQSAPPAQVTWGGPTLSASERDYFMGCMASLLNTWEAWMSSRHALGEPAGDERFMVIDLEGKLIWLARSGQVPARDYVQLPAVVSWKLYGRADDGLDEMSSRVCLKLSRRWRGTLALVGRAPDNTHFSCEMRAPFFHGEMKWEEGDFDPNSLSSSGRVETLSSVLVTDPNHLQRIMSTRPAFAAYEDIASAEEEGPDPIVQRKAIWQRLQKPLYQALEQEAINRGYDVARVSVQPGPDYTAGLAGVGIKSPQTGAARHLWSFLLRRGRGFSPPFLLFTIDALEDGRWHCQTAAAPGGSGPASVRGGFDFYLEQPKSGLDGSQPRPEPDQGTPEWWVDLDDGTCVELIGVCALPGSTWWGPDGTDLDYWPGYWGREGYNQVMFDVISSRSGPIRMQGRAMGREQEEGRVAVVLRVPSSVGFGNSSGSSSSGPVSVHYGKRCPLLDRFGRPGSADSSVQYIVLQFDASRQGSISHALGIHVGGPDCRPGIVRQGSASLQNISRSVVGGVVGRGSAGTRIPSDAMSQADADSDLSLEWILLKNIALHSDQHTEFEMVVAGDVGEFPSTSRVQVRP